MLLLSGSWLAIKAREKQRKDGADEDKEPMRAMMKQERKMATARRKGKKEKLVSWKQKRKEGKEKKRKEK